MTSDQWIQAITGIVSALIGAGAAIVSALLIMWREDVNRPVLQVTFDPDRDVKPQTYFDSWPVTPDTKEYDSLWFRVRVMNSTARNVAKKARAYLCAVRVKQAGRPTIDAMFNDTRMLSWMHGDDYKKEMARDLYPGISHWVDIAKVEATAKDTVSIYSTPGLNINEPGNIEFDIMISAEDVQPISITVVAVWDGTLDSFGGLAPAEGKASSIITMTKLRRFIRWVNGFFGSYGS